VFNSFIVLAVETVTVPPKVAKEHLLMPSARHLSQSKGLDATVLQGTGKDGRITKGDVLKALIDGIEMPPFQAGVASQKATSTPQATTTSTPVAPAAAVSTTATLADVQIPTITASGSYEDIPNNNMRKVIARRLTESKASVPHFYSTVEIELDNILALRKRLKEKDIKVSVNDLIIRGSALALRDVPEINATFNSKSGTVKMSDTVDISVAVATPGGLITPIVPKTDTLGLVGISDKVKDLATRARDGKLSPEEYQGGSFCISNLGMFGISEFSAVINPPQAAILAVGGGVQKVVVNTPYVDGAEEQEAPTVRSVMSARLSADRRVVDEATAALFLSALKCYLNKPELLLL
jgi:pyruvate dehydrogenase E2 component (dihydrolipoamide acetyltransferase)